MLTAVVANLRDGALDDAKAEQYAAESHRWLRRENLADSLSIAERTLVAKSVEDWPEQDAARPRAVTSHSPCGSGRAASAGRAPYEDLLEPPVSRPAARADGRLQERGVPAAGRGDRSCARRRGGGGVGWGAGRRIVTASRRGDAAGADRQGAAEHAHWLRGTRGLGLRASSYRPDRSSGRAGALHEAGEVGRARGPSRAPNVPCSRTSRAARRRVPRAAWTKPLPRLMRRTPAAERTSTLGAPGSASTFTGLDRAPQTVRCPRSRASRAIEHVGAGLLEGLQPLDRVVEIVAAVEVVLGAGGQRERERSAAAASTPAAMRSTAWESE